jgi:MinD superfamily P-loop ATPase
MKQFVILSGKGGTGKTSVAAAFAHLASANGLKGKVILADADVDAANLELVLEPQVLERHEFLGGKTAIIDQEQCLGCGTCADICRFNAIEMQGSAFKVDPIACEGCGACVYQCTGNAIHLETLVAGDWFRSDSRYGPLFHAALNPAQENSGKLVTMVKQQARLLAMDEGRDLVLVDGPPGIGCPVISAVSGADLALIVAEPTAAGVHDMRRVLETTEHFGVRTVVCVNKADIYAEGAAEIEAFCKAHGIEVVGKIPFDPLVTEAMVQGQPVTGYHPNSPASQALAKVWSKVLSALEEVG